MIDARAAKGPGRYRKGRPASPATTPINPYSGEKVPIWIGNFVLMGYGTGAIMAVPAHDERDFEFCKTYGIPIRPVIRPVDGALRSSIRRPRSPTTASSRIPAHSPASRAPKRAAVMNQQRRARRLRQGRDHVSHQGLGHLAAALLGHADSRDPLPEVRRGAGAGEAICRWCCRSTCRSPARAARRCETCPSS